MVIPVACRQRLGIEPGQEVLLRIDESGVHLMTFDQALTNFQNQVAALVGSGVSLVDESIANGQAEATKEVHE